MKGTRKQKKCGPRCQEHLFAIKHTRTDAYMKNDVHMLLCPKPTLENTHADNLFPQFNHDHKEYTPAFILAADRKYYYENQTRLHTEHMKKLKQYTETKKEILFPKPSRKHKYCSACKFQYEDYLEHIKSQGHKRCINASKYNFHILDMCKQLFNNDNKKEVIVIDDKDSGPSSNILDKKVSLSTQFTEPHYDQIETKPYKKRKQQQHFIEIQNKDFFSQIPNTLANNTNMFDFWNQYILPTSIYNNPFLAYPNYNLFPSYQLPPFMNNPPFVIIPEPLKNQQL